MSGAEQKCPICGVTLDDCGSWVQCPTQFDPVCMKCCMKCEYLRDNTSRIFCDFRHTESRKSPES